mmetsp:Transcript_19966/g.39566  ORF Transcript_19966/g.39566 Transcript_19966/m.39566 type:complete len:206 (-) Transcript_19966:154-771(-)
MGEYLSANTLEIADGEDVLKGVLWRFGGLVEEEAQESGDGEEEPLWTPFTTFTQIWANAVTVEGAVFPSNFFMLDSTIAQLKLLPACSRVYKISLGATERSTVTCSAGDRFPRAFEVSCSLCTSPAMLLTETQTPTLARAAISAFKDKTRALTCGSICFAQSLYWCGAAKEGEDREELEKGETRDGGNLKDPEWWWCCCCCIFIW